MLSLYSTQTHLASLREAFFNFFSEMVSSPQIIIFQWQMHLPT